MRIHLLFLLLSFQIIFVSKPSLGQKKYAKKVAQIDVLFQKGNLKSAFKRNESLLNSILESGTKENEYSIKAYLNQGKILQGVGRHFDYEKGLKEATSIVKRLYGDTGKIACETYLGAAETYFYYGNYRKALGMVRSANSTFAKTPKKYFTFYPNYYLISAQIFTKVGFLAKADSFALAALPLLEKRIVKTEPVYDPSGKLKQIKASTQELNNRKLAYAWCISLRGEIAFQKGLYKSADSILKASNQWMKSNYNTSNPAISNNYIIQGKMVEEDGDVKSASNFYAKAYSSVKNRRDQFYFDAFDKMLYGKIIRDEFKSTPRKTLTEIDRKTKMYFKNENVFHGNKEILEEWFLAHKYVRNDVEDRLKELLQSNIYIPKFHPSHIQAQDVFVFLDSRAKNNKCVEDTLWAIMGIMKELYGEQTPAYHMRKLDLANFYFKRTNSIKKAEDIYLESFMGVVSKEMSPRHRKYVPYLDAIGSLYALGENYSKSAEFFQAAERQAKINYGSEDPRYAVVLGDLASVYLGLGKYTQAKEMLERANTILNKGDVDNYTPDYAIAYQEIAEGYSTFGLFDKAEKALEKSNDIMDNNAKKGYDPAENSSPDDVAAFYMNTGEYREAEKILKQSIAEKEKSKGEVARELIKPLNLLGRLYYTTGDYGQSEVQLNRAAKLSASFLGDSSLKYAESLKTLRKLYAAFGDYEKAEQACQKQIAITTRILGKNNINVADALSDLAIIRYNLGVNKNECRKTLNESNQMFKSQLGADNPFYINGLKTLAFFQMETNQFSSADSLIRVVETYWETKLGKDNIYTPELDLMRGDLNRKQGNYDAALTRYNHALSLYKQKFSDKHPDYVRTLSKIAKTYFAKGDYKNSLSSITTTTKDYYDFISKYFPVLSFGEKSKYWDLIKPDFEFFNSLAMKMKDQNPDLIGLMYDYQLATKAILLSNSIKVRQRILSSGNQLLIDKFNTWNNKKDLYTKSLSYTNEQLKAGNLNPENLEKEIESLEKDLSASSEEFAKSFENKSFRWKDVRKTLKDNEAAIEILRFRQYTTTFTDSIVYAALIVSGSTSGNPELVVFKNGRDMEKKFVKYYRNTIKFKNEDDFSYAVFWEPLEPKLKGYTTLYFSSEGVYNQINVETLEDATETHLIDKYNIVLVSNTKDLVLNRIYEKKKIKKNTTNNITLVGNPEFYANYSKITERTIPQLEGAEIEAKEIAELYTSSRWKTSLFTGAKADEEKIKAMEGPRIFHVATHGYFQPDLSSGRDDDEDGLKKNEVNPLLRSGILFADAGDILDNNFSAANVNSQDGILTAYEAMNLNLENTELVTLSACETGLGDVQIGEGVAGLQRSFLVAGAETVVMSLFKVNDEITEKLMLTFYGKWLKLGDKRKAFAEAKKEIKAQHPESIYWGSFIMIGAN